jgi:hypothetical protein
MATPTTDLIRAAALTPQGPARWHEPVPYRRPGVYVVETATQLNSAPISQPAIEAWIRRLPGMRLDGGRAEPTAIADRLASFWIPGERIVYIGRAGTDVGGRVRGYYRTPLGDARPHAGGHWLKTLTILDDLRVWWAAADDPTAAESDLLGAFARRHGPAVLPFANRQDANGIRKAHGITGSTISTRGDSLGKTLVGTTPRTTTARSRSIASVVEINAALQRFACGDPRQEVTAVEAAAALDRLGVLHDSPDRPGLPLRRLLREGRIEHARQDGGRWWFIECGGR